MGVVNRRPVDAEIGENVRSNVARSRVADRYFDEPYYLEPNGKAGVNALRFTGRIGSKKLKRGGYRLILTPAGGKAASVKFTILR